MRNQNEQPGLLTSRPREGGGGGGDDGGPCSGVNSAAEC